MLTVADRRQARDENRFVGIGFLRQRVVLVVFAEREDDTIRQRLPTRITKARARILLHRVTRRAGDIFAQVRAARRTVSRTGAGSGAAGAAASGQWRYVTAGFARNVIFDNLPRVFGEFVLPVSAERREREQ